MGTVILEASTFGYTLFSSDYIATITSPISPDLSAVSCKAKEGGPFIMPLGASEAVVNQSFRAFCV